MGSYLDVYDDGLRKMNLVQNFIPLLQPQILSELMMIKINLGKAEDQW
jgi:hypothetical protein